MLICIVSHTRLLQKTHHRQSLGLPLSTRSHNHTLRFLVFYWCVAADCNGHIHSSNSGASGRPSPSYRRWYNKPISLCTGTSCSQHDPSAPIKCTGALCGACPEHLYVLVLYDVMWKVLVISNVFVSKESIYFEAVFVFMLDIIHESFACPLYVSKQSAHFCSV